MRDWALPPSPRELSTPWVTRPARRADGLYVEAESGRAGSAAWWADLVARHGEQGRPRWSRSPGGVLFLLAGERFALLHPGWSAGHLPVTGGAGVALVRDVSFDLARRSAEDWWLERQAELAAAVDVDSLLRSAVA